MSHVIRERPLAPVPLARSISVAFQFALWTALLLIVTAFGDLHRYGTMDLLLTVFALLTLWVVYSLVVYPLRYARATANLFLWAVLALLLLQVVPLPRNEVIGMNPASLGPPAGFLVENLYRGHFHRAGEFDVARYSLRPAATLSALLLVASAAGIYWLVGSALYGRKELRRITWVALLGLAPLALWTLVSALRRADPVIPGVFRPFGPILILGGSSLVPALLAGLPLGVAVVLRLAGWMPRRPARVRQTGMAWLGRAGPVWAAIGLAMVGLMAVALGMSSVSWGLLLGCVLISIVFPLVGYAAAARGRRKHRRPALFAAGILVWILLALGLGYWLGPERYEAVSGNEQLESLIASLSGWRAAFGVGCGAVSPRLVYGTVGWPAADGYANHSSGYLLLRAELGWMGLVLALAAAVALIVFLARAWRRTKSPWPHTMTDVGFGVLAANLLFFQFDASALVAPNLLALAAVMGLVMAWAAHGIIWRRARWRELARAHWPLTLGAVSLTGVLATAESDMFLAASRPNHAVNAKLLHFGGFAVLNLYFCLAFCPTASLRWLKARVLMATAMTVLIGVLVEYAQRCLTASRTFAVRDMVIDTAGAVLMALWWWLVHRAHVIKPGEPGLTPPSA